MKFADLHVHTNYSDSTFTPEEVVAAARDKGLAAVAICDHDCVDGIQPCREFASRSNIDIEIIPGVELTAEKDDAEIHMLGYFMDWTDERFQETLLSIRNSRLERMYEMLRLLKAHNIDIDPRDVFKLARDKGSVGRLHLARAMLNSRKVNTLEEVFNKYIGFGKPCYVPHTHFDPKKAIELILGVGGAPVLAHPYTLDRDDLIKDFAAEGLRGIEVYHSDHNASISRRYEKIAKEHGLIATGGSDCHGLGKENAQLGRVKIPYSVVEELKKISKAR